MCGCPGTGSTSGPHGIVRSTRRTPLPLDQESAVLDDYAPVQSQRGAEQQAVQMQFADHRLADDVVVADGDMRRAPVLLVLRNRSDQAGLVVCAIDDYLHHAS